MSLKTEFKLHRKDPATLSNDEIVKHQEELLKEWKPQYEVFSLRFGHFIVGAAASVSGIMINSYFRQKLQLRNLGFSLTNAALFVGPLMLSTTLHNFKIREKILVFNPDCAMCLDTKAAIYQTAGAILYPTILATVLNLGVAASGGLRVPAWYEGGEILKLVRDVLKPRIPNLTTMVTLNAAIAIAVTQHELLSMDRIQEIMLKIEKKMHSKYVEHFQ